MITHYQIPETIMSAHRVPNLRRDLPISVLLLIMALVAVVPRAVAVIIALAGFMGLMVLRFTMRDVVRPRRNAFVHARVSTQPDSTMSRGGSHAACAA